MAASTPASTPPITYLGQQEAVAVDEELMGPLGFSVDQLMELAGLSVACSVASEYPASSYARVLVVAGPGNNGGDGLVAARHLFHFGYDVQVAYPKQTDKPLYKGLVTQCKSLGITFLSTEELLGGPIRERADAVIDAMFGFSFKGAPRPPFDAILEALKPAAGPPPLVAVDIPSGWHVEAGDEAGDGLRPDMLVSLTAPKKAARSFAGRFHYLGGRFVPPAIRDKYGLQLPPFPGTAQCVRLAGGNDGKPVADMRATYGEGGGGLVEGDADPDPMQQFDRWFKEACASSLQEPNAMALATVGPAATPNGAAAAQPPPPAPAVRMVLLKGYDARGFLFYTNYGSRKGRELEAASGAALCFWWEPLQKSVRVEGRVARLPEEESCAYFASRPRASQLGAMVSQQSAVLAGGRQELEAVAEALFKEYEDESVPVQRPANWGGYLVQPTAVEFWQGRPSRLHDRLRYERQADGTWRIVRLSP